MKRVLVDCHSFDYNYFQGVTTYLSGLYRESIRQSSDIQFYLASNDIEKLISVFGLHSNVTYVKLRFKNSLMRLILELPYQILKNKIDYIHVQYKVPVIKLCKEIVTVHDVLFLDFPENFPRSFNIINKLYYKFSSKRADILLTVSNYSKSRISKQFNIQEQKILITPNGIDESFLLLSINNKLITNVKTKYGLDRYILYVSRIEPRKNHQLIVNAYQDLKLADKGYKLVFIGATTFENKILNSDLERLSTDNFIILENIPTEE